jgi:hypothetical protein
VDLKEIFNFNDELFNANKSYVHLNLEDEYFVSNNWLTSVIEHKEQFNCKLSILNLDICVNNNGFDQVDHDLFLFKLGNYGFNIIQLIYFETISKNVKSMLKLII